jgi:tetratricopeptide (TPR) repeat protein
MPELTAEQALQLAIQHHNAGRLRDAEVIYRQILAQQPNHPDALHLLGVLAHQAGQLDTGIDLIRRAIAIKSTSPEYFSNLGNALREKGLIEDAIEAHRAGLRLRPDFAVIHYNLGNTLRQAGRIDEALASYREAVRFEPRIAGMRNSLAVTLRLKGLLSEAEVEQRKAVRLDPNFDMAQSNLGVLLRDIGKLDESIAACREAIRLNPNFAEAHYNLGTALYDQGRLDETAAAFREAIRLKPDSADAHNNLATVMADSQRPNEAIAGYREALRYKPDYAEVHWNLALNLLLQGNFAEGWPEYSWLSRCKEFASPNWNLPQPTWDGRELNGQTILLHAEQGFGDAIQFVRYAPLVVQRGGRVVIQCQRELVDLFRAAPNLGHVVAADENLPPFDRHCSLLELPMIFRSDLQSIPRNVPYLQVDDSLQNLWRERLASAPGLLRVGLAWAGNPIHRRDHKRSLRLAQLQPLASRPDVTFISLQKGPASDEAKHPPDGMALLDFTNELTDFQQTAALISNLDLVIAVDTAVIHLAGALGKPAWLLITAVPDWRWLIDRGDSPWYPTLRIFRQREPGDWDSAIAAATAELLRGQNRHL